MRLVLEGGEKRLVLDIEYLAKTYGIEFLTAAYVELEEKGGGVIFHHDPNNPLCLKGQCDCVG